MSIVKYVIELSEEERERLITIVTKGSKSVQTILQPNILLASNRNNKKHKTILEIAEIFYCTPRTVQYVRTKYENNGIGYNLSKEMRNATSTT